MADSYWRERQEKMQSLSKSEAELNAALKKYYAKESEKLSREIASYYGKYGENNVIEYRKLLLSLTDTERQLLFEDYDAFAEKYPEYADLLPVRESIYKLNRAEGLKTSILIQQLEMGAIERNRLQAHFEKMAALFVESSANFLAVDKNVAKLVVGQAWFEETDFSARIWKNRQALAKALQNDVVNGIIRGEDYKRISRSIQEKFERVSKRDIERLVFTEDTYLVNEAAMQTYVNDPDFSEYEYMIADGRACDICASLDGQRFQIAERVAGVNFPPMHPWCRCTFVPVYEGNSSEKRAYFRKDGLTGSENGGIIKTDKFNSKSDPMREVTGSGEKSNPNEIAAFRKRLNELNVEIIEKEDESLAYSPALQAGRPGTVYISEGASYSAWCHEMQHVEDDYKDGWSGMRILADLDNRYAREVNAYNLEIQLAKEAGREDIAERLKENLEEERKRIYGE